MLVRLPLLVEDPGVPDVTLEQPQLPHLLPREDQCVEESSIRWSNQRRVSGISDLRGWVEAQMLARLVTYGLLLIYARSVIDKVLTMG